MQNMCYTFPRSNFGTSQTIFVVPTDSTYNAKLIIVLFQCMALPDCNSTCLIYIPASTCKYHTLYVHAVYKDDMESYGLQFSGDIID